MIALTLIPLFLLFFYVGYLYGKKERLNEEKSKLVFMSNNLKKILSDTQASIDNHTERVSNIFDAQDDAELKAISYSFCMNCFDTNVSVCKDLTYLDTILSEKLRS